MCMCCVCEQFVLCVCVGHCVLSCECFVVYESMCLWCVFVYACMFLPCVEYVLCVITFCMCLMCISMYLCICISVILLCVLCASTSSCAPVCMHVCVCLIICANAFFKMTCPSITSVFLCLHNLHLCMFSVCILLCVYSSFSRPSHMHAGEKTFLVCK